MSYDKNGNIMGLIRQGQTIENPNLALGAGYGTMDNLVYAYDSGNKLLKVTDNANDTYGFKDGINTGDDFTYDVNGNMLTDANKGITSITYNHLNLPTQVTIAGQNILYIYDAVGTKLRKTVNSITTDYAGNYIYENSVLQFFSTAEGYVEPVSAGSTTFVYVYQYKDHLGNIRLSYADSNGDGVISPSFGGGQGEAEIREENNYYPFGLKHKGYNNQIGGSRDHKYGYNGKEEQDELSLAWLDFGARNYDASLGRWFGIDKKAELYFGRSPYIYALNTPIQAIDPDGNLVIFINGNHFGSGSDNRGRGTPDYWRTGKNTGFDIDVMNHLNDHNAIYRDGSLGGFAPFNTYSLDPGLRKDIGFKQGKKDAELIIASLQKDSDGNIVESIKIISHSMGGAYAKGYVEAILEYAKQNGITGLIIAFEADFAPFQSEDQKAVKAKNMGPTIQFSNEDDFIAGNKPIDGAEQEDTSDDEGQGHSILDFIDQIKKLPTGNYKVENGKIVPVKEK